MSTAEARKEPAEILIGTSGFSYQDWKGPFYPEKLPAREMLGYYAESFPVVEINSTYYAIPRPENMARMVDKTGGKIEFSVKAHQDLTHHRERSPAAIAPFLEALQPMKQGGVLGCVLLQFPYSFRFNPQNLEYVARLKGAFGDIPVVAEFRNRWWVQDKTFDFLRNNGIGFCCVDEPALEGLPPATAEATSSTGYIRFHGRDRKHWWAHEKAEQRYDYEYSDAELREWLVRIEVLRWIVRKLYIFFNNHPRGQAVGNARTMTRLVREIS